MYVYHGLIIKSYQMLHHTPADFPPHNPFLDQPGADLRAFFHRGINGGIRGGLGVYSHSIPIPFPLTQIQITDYRLQISTDPNRTRISVFHRNMEGAFLIPLEQVE